MKKLGKTLRLILGLSVLAVALSVPTSSRAVDPGPISGLNVTVTNTTSNPVPVTGTVSVGNTLTGSVSITGTPSVNVANTSSSPVPTQNAGGGAATHLGQTASKLINLTCFGGAVGGDCLQTLPTGSLGPVFTVPADQVLVITDLEFQVLSAQVTPSPGVYLTVVLTVNGNVVAMFASPEDSTSAAYGHEHMTTGIVAAGGASISVFGPGTSFVQGYLVPNQ